MLFLRDLATEIDHSAIHMLVSKILNFEAKHACYAATGAMQVALGWLQSGILPGRKALIVSTDQTTLTLGQPWEPIMRAVAAAFLGNESLAAEAYWELEEDFPDVAVGAIA